MVQTIINGKCVGRIDSGNPNVDDALSKLISYIEDLKNKHNKESQAIGEANVRAAEIMEELEAAKELAEAATKAKTMFLSNMSHEIRTPMNGIVGFTEMLLEGDLNEEAKDQISMIKSCADSLLIVINDILEFSKMEENMVILENKPFDLIALLNDVVQVIQQMPLARDRELDILAYVPENMIYVIGDKYRLRQIFLNLLNNAVKFTEQGYVNLKLTTTESKPGFLNLSIEVEDSGIGIPHNKISSIFNDFTQSDPSNTRKFGGTGLGLSISKKLADLMGGSLTVQSEEHKGSSFFLNLELPLLKENPTQQNASNEKQNHTFEGNILVVEDNLVNQKLIQKTLNKLGLEVTISENGFRATNEAKNNKYDLIFMDLQMPVMDGIEATKKIREFDQTTPIVALTANVMGNIGDESKKAGMNDYLFKPLKKKYLLDVLNRFLK